MMRKVEMRITFYSKARAQLAAIWRYTVPKWGVAQADKYVRGIHQLIKALPEKRYVWRVIARPDLGGVYYVSFQSHFIFFRELPQGGVGIISILHRSMHVPDHLLDDQEDTAH